MIAIIIGLSVLGIIVWKIYPIINTPNTSEFTMEDKFKEVITDENTIHVKKHDKDRVKEEVIEATVITTDDFVKKETINDNIGGKKLTEHIAEVIQLNPDSKKHLNKRPRKTKTSI